MRVSSRSTMTDAQSKAFGAEIKRLRKAAGMTALQFAEYIGISNSYLCKVESGNKAPSPQLAEHIAKTFDTTVEDMLKPTEERKVEAWRAYGVSLRDRRAAKGLSSQVVAGALGVPLEVYREYEFGKCSVTDRQKEVLERLLGDTETKEEPKEPEPIEVEVTEAPAIVVDESMEICDIILEHIKDLKVDSDTQKKVWRYFRNMKLDAEERSLFG